MYKKNISAFRSDYAYDKLVRRSEAGANMNLRLFRALIERMENYAFSHEIEHELELIDLVDAIYDKITE